MLTLIIVCSELLTCCNSKGSSNTNNWAKVSPTLAVIPTVSWHNLGKSLIA